jgi:hypothetical protein
LDTVRIIQRFHALFYTPQSVIRRLGGRASVVAIAPSFPEIEPEIRTRGLARH